MCLGEPFSAIANANNGWVFGLPDPPYETWCASPVSYQWSWSLDPKFSKSYIIGTNSPLLTLPYPIACPQFYLRVTISNTQGFTTSSTQLVKCLVGACPRNVNTVPEFTANVLPNPATGFDRVLYSGIGSLQDVSIVSLAGTTQQLLTYVSSSEGELSCNIENFPSGLYYLRLNGSKSSQVIKLSIIR
jgi:hypothetical protein